MSNLTNHRSEVKNGKNTIFEKSKTKVPPKKEIDYDEVLHDLDWIIPGIICSAQKTSYDEKMDRFSHQDSKWQRWLWNDNYRLARTMRVAASLTLLAVLAIMLLRIDNSLTNQELYASYYVPFENYSQHRNGVQNQDSSWKNALQAYDAGEYRQALDFFEAMELNAEQQQNIAIRPAMFRMYKGNLLMQLNDHQKAIAEFKGILEADAGMIIQAKWFLSLCYLHEGNLDESIALLEEIVMVEASSFAIKSRELLDKM